MPTSPVQPDGFLSKAGEKNGRKWRENTGIGGAPVLPNIDPEAER